MILFNDGLIPQLIVHFGMEGNEARLLYAVGFLLCVVIPYLLGSLNFAIIISRLVYHDDIRKYGSGNAGMTNMTRTYGKKAGIFTFLGDFLKTVVAVLFGMLTLGIVPGGGSIAGFFCVLGHMFPIFSHFRGGKGVVAAGTVLIMLNCYSLEGLFLCIIVFGIFFAVVIGTKYVSLGSIMAALLYPLLQSQLNNDSGFKPIFALLTTCMIVFRHIENIKRLRDGTESKMPFGRSGKKDNKQ